ncbi:MAG: translation elongation factor Ts [Patescibacteria group bacterium]
MKSSIGDIKKLREKTGAGVSDCQKALIEAKGNFDKALKILQKQGREIAAKKSGRTTGQGLIETYVHSDGRVAAMVEINCETDFVARTDDFKNLAHQLALQVASMDPADVDDLLHQEYIRDSASGERSRTIEDLVAEVIAKTGENIKIKRFVRFELGG